VRLTKSELTLDCRRHARLQSPTPGTERVLSGRNNPGNIGHASGATELLGAREEFDARYGLVDPMFAMVRARAFVLASGVLVWASTSGCSGHSVREVPLPTAPTGIVLDDVRGVLLRGGEIIRFQAVLDVRRTPSELIVEVATGASLGSTHAFPIDDVVGILVEEDSPPGGWSKFGRGVLGFAAGAFAFLTTLIISDF